MLKLIILILSSLIGLILTEQSVSIIQTDVGNYKLLLDTENITRSEVSSNGKIAGSYSYKDDVGEVHSIQYTASDKGFEASGDLVRETPEVAAARKQHLAFVNEQRAKLPILKEEELEGVEVEDANEEIVKATQLRSLIGDADTPEVVDARISHFKAYNLALQRLEYENRRTRSV